MSAHSFENNEDFFEFVKTLSENLGDLGFADAQADLLRLFGIAWTTSSELFGEIGLACNRILSRDGKRLPPGLKDNLKKVRKACRRAFH
jgi:hypothetical protein